MASTNFINQQTVIQADWLNDVNTVTYDLLGNGTTIPASKSALLTSIGALGSANNLSDIGSAATARTNLGVTATGADTTYLFRTNNLSDLANATTARTNLGLGSIATQTSSSVSITGGTITGITDLAVADGGTGASTITANSVILGNGTSALSGNLVAPGTSGNVLTSNGTTWQSTAPTSSNMVLVAPAISVTASNSVNTGTVSLTSYKALFIVINNVIMNTGKVCYVSSNNQQSGGAWGITTSGISNSGTLWLDLTTGAIGGSVSESTYTTSNTTSAGGLTNVTTASTTIHFRMPSTNQFSAQGTITVYGVR